MCLNVVSIKDINNYNLLCVPLSKMFAAKKFHQDTVALKKKKNFFLVFSHMAEALWLSKILNWDSFEQIFKLTYLSNQNKL